MKKKMAAILVTGALLSLMAVPAEAAENPGITAEEVNVAIQPSAAFIPFYIVRENGWLEEALAEYGVEVNWNDFESGPPMNESMAAGLSDIGFLGDVPAVSAIAAGQDNELVAIAANGLTAYALLAPADSEVENAGDLEGKTVATVVGSTGHNLVQKILAEYGLDINSDINFVNISAGDAAVVLSTGQADAVAIWEPNVTRLVENGTAKIIGVGTDCGLLGVNPIAVRSDFAEGNEEILKIVIEQYARGMAALEDLDEETLNAVAEDLSLEPEQLLPVAEKYDYKVKISQEEIDGLQDTIEFLVKIGTLTESYQISDYITTQYVDEADIDGYLN